MRLKKSAKEKEEMDKELQHLMFEIPLAIEPCLNGLGIREHSGLITQKSMQRDYKALF